MRVLGVDPGSRFVGYGAIARTDGRLSALRFGTIRAQPRAPLAERLAVIFRELQTIIDEVRPESLAVEGVFGRQWQRSALILGQARGVVVLAAGLAGLPVYEYPPARVKHAIGAGGGADKRAVATMVRRLLGIAAADERSDAYDALAIAICHANRVPATSGAAQTLRTRLRPAVVPPR